VPAVAACSLSEGTVDLKVPAGTDELLATDCDGAVAVADQQHSLTLEEGTQIFIEDRPQVASTF
jgi:hypothetical protein